mmetsp:Transcript_12099/g.26430  ORF Transcript_12099/g.26430 Transcript_12099/m.26430 type:complete len:93 (+) Transcript_12099:181-459(+)
MPVLKDQSAARTDERDITRSWRESGEIVMLVNVVVDDSFYVRRKLGLVVTQSVVVDQRKRQPMFALRKSQKIDLVNGRDEVITVGFKTELTE